MLGMKASLSHGSFCSCESYGKLTATGELPDLFQFIVQSKDEFIKGDTMYKYDWIKKKWEPSCGSGHIEHDCPLCNVNGAIKSPLYPNRRYINVTVAHCLAYNER